MIRKKNINDIELKFKNLEKSLDDSKQVMFNYLQLSKIFSDEFFIPFTEWSVSPSTILHLLNDIELNNRKCIIEFGSGASTIFIAKYLKMKNTGVKFFSIESDKIWKDYIDKKIEELSLKGHVESIYAPIVNVEKNIQYKNQKYWYDSTKILEEISNDNLFDVVLVDGPIGSLSPYSRSSAIPFLLEHKFLSNNYSIFLDDVHRDDEKEIVEYWKSILGSDSKLIERYCILYKEMRFESFPFKL